MHSYQQDQFQGQFNDSVVIHPIHMKSNIVPSFLHRGTFQHATLATYDKFKLSQYADMEQSSAGQVINILSVDPHSLMINITKQGVQFFEKYSSNDIVFISVVGDKQVGKSFFLDKILNLTNINGNHVQVQIIKFCQINKPGINLWSIPFIKEQLKIFVLQISNFEISSKQFKALAPFITILSSVVLNLNHYNNQSVKSDNLKNIIIQTIQCIKTKDQDKKKKILPQFYYNLYRVNKGHISSIQNINVKQMCLPNAMNKQYSGQISDLKSHSFLNKKCISEDYIKNVSEIFQDIYKSINQKRYRQLIFNGNILLKLIKYVQLLLNQNKKIQLDPIYDQIVKDLYISAYNYCVISYHEELQSALQSQQPNSLQNLIIIFQNASKDVLEKYNQFTLDTQCHRHYEHKLLDHIQSKQMLILQINKKKTSVQIQKIMEKTDIKNLEAAWLNIKTINKQYKDLNHGKTKVIGQYLNKILLNTKNSNNIDYRVLKQIQILQITTKQKQIQLINMKDKNKRLNQQQFKINQQRKILQLNASNLQQKLRNVNRQIKIYGSHQQYNKEQLEEVKNKLQAKQQRNQQLLDQLRSNQNPEAEKLKKDKIRQIQSIVNKQRLLQTTLQDLQKQKGASGQQANKQGNGTMERQSKVRKDSALKKQQSSTSKITDNKKMKRNSKK